MIEIAFETFFKSKVPLLEGGNVRVVNHKGREIQAQKIDLSKHQRTPLIKKLLEFFHTLNAKFENSNGEKIWKIEDLIDSGHIFNGSSEHFFNLNIADKDFAKYKKTVGDIDVSVPVDKKQELFEFLQKLKGHQVTQHVSFVGIKQTNLAKGHQLNTLVCIDSILNIQIDFEFLEYREHSPSKFAKFSHSSSWEDIKQGFKGVLHKYLLQSLAGSSDLKTSEQVALFTKAATIQKPKLVKTFPPRGLSLKKFSVDRGLRTDAFKRLKDEQGNLISHEGKPVYKETDTEESMYITEPELIAREIFGSKFSSEDISKFNSFVGLIDLCIKYFTPTDRLNVIKDFQRRLFGVGAQGFERNNPSLDYEVKKAGFQKVKRNFKITSFPDLPQTYEDLMSLSEDGSTHPILLQVKTYYENYRMTGDIED
jgi:hypothetical protein